MPTATLILCENHCSEIEDLLLKYPLSQVYLFGDYNLPHVGWSDSEEGLSISTDLPPAVSLKNSFNFLNLSQKNSVINRNGVLLDLLFTNDSDANVFSAEEVLLPIDYHGGHPALCLSISNVKLVHNALPFEEYYYNFKLANYEAMNNYFLSLDWISVLRGLEMADASNLFYEILYSAFRQFVPLSVKKPSTFPIWFSPELKNLIMQKKQSHKLFKHSGNQDHYTRFCELRTLCKSMSIECYQDYILEVQNTLKVNPKHFWHFINSKKKETGLPSYMYFKDVSSTDGKKTVNLFASYFSSVYSTNSNDYVPDINPNSVNNIDLLSVTEEEVLDKIISSENSTCIGPDKVPLTLLKSCSISLSTPLTILFNLSLSYGCFPDVWKSSYISPIFKSGDKSDISNYRPISILSAIPKLFESLIYDKLYHHVKHVIGSNQHGFMRGRSTTTNLVSFVEDIFESLALRHQVDAIYTDFSKAFDTVNHRILINKLEQYGFSPKLVSWIKSYLTGRIQYVRYKNYISNAIVVTSGVPQGSHLGPLFFNLFINDLINCFLNCKALLFADDLKMYKSISSFDDYSKLQKDLEALSVWCTSNLMALNLSKCKVITFFKCKNPALYSYTLNETTLTRADSVLDLGVTLDTSLTFKSHICSISSKALKTLGFIIRNGIELNVDSIKILYFALVRSLLEYCSPVWSPYFDSYAMCLERIQSRFLRFCAFKMGKSLAIGVYSSTYMRNWLSVDTLSDRRFNADLIFIFKMLNYLFECEEILFKIPIHVPARSTRSTVAFAMRIPKTNYLKFSPLNRMLSNCNQRDLDFFGSSLPGFKRKLHQLFQ